MVALVQTCLGLSGKSEVRVQVNWLLCVPGQQFPTDSQGNGGRPQEGTDESERFSWCKLHTSLYTSMSSFSPLRHPKGAGFYYSIFSEE